MRIQVEKFLALTALLAGGSLMRCRRRIRT